jgi:hypothetical protein
MATQTVLAISPINSGVFNRLFRHQVTEWGADGEPLKGTVGVTWAVNCDLRVLLAGCETAAARIQKIGNFLRPAEPDAWWSGLQERRVSEVTPQGPKMLNAFFEFCQQPDGALFIIKKGTEGKWVARKTSGYSFLPGSEETAAKGLFQHRVGFEIVRPCVGAERDIPLGRPTIVEHRIFVDAVVPAEDAPVVPEDQAAEPVVEVPPYVLAPAPAGVFHAEPAAEEPSAEQPAAHRRITQKTVLTLAEDHSEIAERILAGEITSPIWGTAEYVSGWRTAKHGPDSPLCAKIREILAAIGPMSKGELTERLQAALGASPKAADAQIRELSKMGILLF